MPRTFFLAFFFFTFLLTGCSSSNNKKESPKEHFDIPGFFEKQVNELQAINPAVEKKINKDGKTETKTLENIDWKKELAPFFDVDINKPSWIKSFSADTVFLTSNRFEITYTANEDETPVKQVKLLFENNSCNFVQINKKSNNKLFSFYQELEYRKGEGYKINGYQSVKYAFDTSYEIISEFIINKNVQSKQ